MNRRKVTTVVAVLVMALFTRSQSVPAQTNCQQAKGLQDGEWDPVTNTTTGTITQGGWLNGTTLDAFRMDTLPAGDPTTVPVCVIVAARVPERTFETPKSRTLATIVPVG